MECRGEVTMDFYEIMISGDTITTAADNTLTVRHDCRSNTISFADAVGRLCGDGTLSVSSNSGTSVYHRFDLPDPEELILLQDQWYWQDENRPSDTSLLTIRGACWHIDNGQSEGWGLLHRRTADGAVTLNTCALHTSSRGQLKLRLPIGGTFLFLRRPQSLMSIREESDEEMKQVTTSCGGTCLRSWLLSRPFFPSKCLFFPCIFHQQAFGTLLVVHAESTTACIAVGKTIDEVASERSSCDTCIVVDCLHEVPLAVLMMRCGFKAACRFKFSGCMCR